MSTAPPSAPALLLRNVKKSYRVPGEPPLPVLDVPSFQLAAGEQTVLVGTSGGGKTTLLNVIAGITPCDSGTVEVGGVDITGMPEAVRDRFRAERIGIVFQSFNLLPAFTALENVLLGMAFSGKANRKQAVQLLEAVGLSDRLGHTPGRLSVGQQQRVAVARALANSPRLMLADEPTASVDLANQTKMVTLIREQCEAQNVALLLVTHDPDVAGQFDRVVELETFNRAAGRQAAAASVTAPA